MEEPMQHRERSSRSPVHIHVKDTTPVHVHVKKPKKTRQQTIEFALPDRKEDGGKGSSGNLRRSTVAIQTRSRSPASLKVTQNKRNPQWRSKSPGIKYSWQGPSLRLDISKPRNKSDHESENDDEEFLNRANNNYEKKLNGLKTQTKLGVLKNQKREKNEKSICALEEQDKELEKYKYELEATEKENWKLCRSLEKLCDETEFTRISGRPEIEFSRERDRILEKLLEIELEGQAVSKQAALLSETVEYFKDTDRRLTPSDSSLVIKNKKEVLDDTIRRFDLSIRFLRSLLHEQQEEDLQSVKVGEQRDLLLTKLSRVQDSHRVLKQCLLEREHQISDLLLQLDAQKEENLSVSGQHSSLKIMNAHLQNQLRQKEADCNRMAVQIRTLESQLAQERIDVDHLRGLLVQAKEKVDYDKEALKKSTRLQKVRASKSEDALEQIKVELMEKETILTDQQSEIEMLHSQLSKVSKEKAQAIAELSACKVRLEELENVMDGVESDAKNQVDVASMRFHEKAGEATALRLENEQLKASLISFDNKLQEADADIVQLRATVKEYEPLVNDYRSQMNHSRREADNLMNQLEEQKRETMKTERQTDQLIDTRERHLRSEDENKSLLIKLDALDKKLSSVEEQNRELISINAKREEALNQINRKLEDRLNENTSLQRQLDSAVAEMRRLKEEEREKISTVERVLQTHILELEAQLSQSKADVSRAKREKEEAERKFNSRLYDLNDELQQSYGSNRSLQNYVQFLKNSYASSFNDLAGSSSLSPQRTSLI